MNNLDKGFEFVAEGRMLQLSDRLQFDLPDPLSGHIEPLSNFFQCVFPSIDQTISHF